MYSEFRVQPHPFQPINNNPLAVDRTHPAYAECSHCGVGMLATAGPALCNYCSNYRAVRKAAAELSLTPTADSHTTTTLGKRKAEAPLEPRRRLPLPACVEFQTMSGMYENLSTSLKTFYQENATSKPRPPYIAFHGAYSVIADPTLSNARQVLLVSQDLKKAVKLDHHHNDTPESPNERTSTITCRCDCDRKVIRRAIPLPPPPSLVTPRNGPFLTLAPANWQPKPPTQTPAATPASTPSSAKKKPAPKQKQTSLSSWILRAGSKKAHSAPQTAVSAPASAAVTVKTEPVVQYEEEILECGGEIRITVTDDHSHPFFKGQKITIEVSHPTRL